MFTFGIFTTHIPYIAMLAFYAYFLIFGVNKARDGQIQLAKESTTIEIQTNDVVHPDSEHRNNYYYSCVAEMPARVRKIVREKQKWKYPGVDKILPENFLNSSLFCRPPPAFA